MSTSLIVICPKMAPSQKSEAELFGAMVWLWMHSPTHRRCPLEHLQRLLMPAIKTGQFVLVLRNDEHQQPVGVMTWANLTDEAERRYLQSLDRTLQPRDWEEGDRPWVLDIVVPFGGTLQMVSAIRRLLPMSSFRRLHHRGDEIGLRVRYFRGLGVTAEEQARYWASRPLPKNFNQ